MSEEDFRLIESIHQVTPITEVVCGGATGADADGKRWGMVTGIPVKTFQADWETHQRAAGPIRNGQMAGYADALIAFPGGRGTADMIKKARKHGLRVWDFTQNQS